MSKDKKHNKKQNINLAEKLNRKDIEFYGSDHFLGKDILTLPNKISSSRNIMFSSHIEQAVMLKNPEIPMMYTNYEKLVGSYSSAYNKAKDDLEVVAKISKFSSHPDMNYYLIVKDSKGVHNIIHRKHSEKLTEGYCFLYQNEVIDSKQEGEVIKQDEILYRSTSFDDDMNYRYGLNAKTVYMIHNDTIEDAIVCSESFAKRMTSNHMSEVEVNINNNDILCNLYGGDEDYKTFPDIGEDTKDRLLLSRRRITYEHALYDLQKDNLRKVNYSMDTPFYAEGTLIDIDIFCNESVERLKKYQYNKQIIKYLEMQNAFYDRIIEVLEPIVANEKHTDDLSYFLRRAQDIMDPEVTWKNEKSDFDNIVITFQIIEDLPLNIGSKIVGRYGKLLPYYTVMYN